MNYLKKHPDANRAYRARWADAWKRMMASGAYGPEEEDTERRRVLAEAAGVNSSSDLTRDGYNEVMRALGQITGDVPADKPLWNSWRAKRIGRIEQVARKLRPENPESYIVGVLDGMDLVQDPAKWRTALIDEYLHSLMLTMVSQERRGRNDPALPLAGRNQTQNS